MLCEAYLLALSFFFFSIRPLQVLSTFYKELHKGYVRSREIIFGGKLRRRQHLFPTIFTHITQLRLIDLFLFSFFTKSFFLFFPWFVFSILFPVVDL